MCACVCVCVRAHSGRERERAIVIIHEMQTLLYNMCSMVNVLSIGYQVTTLKCDVRVCDICLYRLSW